MDDDKTVFRPIRQPTDSAPHRPAGDYGIDVSWRLESGQYQNLRFFTPFSIGRDATCAVQIHDSRVSRHHAEAFFRDGSWHIRDLDSTNGTFLNGKRIREAAIGDKCEIGLGREETSVWLSPQSAPPGHAEPRDEEPESATQFVRRYFEDGEGPETEQAKIVREAFERISKKRTRTYRSLLVLVLLLLCVASGFGIYEYRKLEKLRGLATNIFFTMKALEVQLAQQEIVAGETGGFEDQDELDAKRQKLASLGREYDQYLEQTHLFGITMSEEDQLIYKVARVFGECELNMPPSFVREVKRYIKKWKSTPALEQAIARAEAHGFLPVVQRAMAKEDLPVQFFYLGLRESGFNIKAVGPKTRFGFAKGPWQFIPSTAKRYGMNTGPLVDAPQFDSRDDRFDIYKSTYAAARYLKDIYATDAQASGLLVMASYNWGEDNINQLLNKMPENPRDRNFWELINRFEIPDETYQYVLYIFSAAVIGENPGVFGFDFDDPLAAIKNPAD